MNHFFKKEGKRSIIRIGAAGLVIFCCALVLSGCKAPVPERVEKTDTAMGTIVRQSIYATCQDAAPTEEVMACLRDLETELLSWRLEGSELFFINETAAGAEGKQTAVEISFEMAAILERCLEISKKSKGAFDVTLGRAVRLWDIDRQAAEALNPVIPTEKQLSEAMEHCGYEKLVLRGNTLVLPAGMQLDLGAVGKGVALEEAKRLLVRRKEVTGAVISVGGSILTYGEKPDGNPFKVEVANPLDETKAIGYLELPGGMTVSTSGDYRRFVELEGVRYHHILNPHTGKPAETGLAGVTVLSGEGLLGDALSTACFVLGTEQGMDLAEAFGAEALFVDSQGGVSMTEGMEAYFYPYY